MKWVEIITLRIGVVDGILFDVVAGLLAIRTITMFKGLYPAALGTSRPTR